jgi:23S rRNA pseudouridine1911/1915/1917 synthase
VRKGQALRPGTELEVEIAVLATALALEAEPAVAILFEDDWLVALDKPGGRPSHALRFEDRGTIANFLAARWPESRDASENPLDHGLVHRLDTGTSGVLLAARRRDAWAEARRQFRAREIGKRYLALVDGPLGEAGEVRRPIEPDPKNHRRVRVVTSTAPSAGARDATTRYRPLARYRDHTLLDVAITTGVMHQIRAHLSSIGHPVTGDPLYGPAAESIPARHWLHAATLELTHPGTAARLKIESPLPPDFTAKLATLPQ